MGNITVRGGANWVTPVLNQAEKTHKAQAVGLAVTPPLCSHNSPLTTYHSPLTKPMHLSMLLSSLPLDFEAALRQTVALGFTHVDVVALADRPETHLHALADSGLLVACAAVGRGLPEGHTLDAVSADIRRRALEEMKRHVTDAARLGASHAYIIPDLDASAEGLARFTEACTLLADHAGQRMIRLCVEHIPGRALPCVHAALAWLERAGHDNLALLLDVGHCLISGEDPVRAIHQAGGRLGYVHFDDNDGINDLHWPLMTGRLTDDVIQGTISALHEEHYRGALSLELNPGNPDPVKGLRDGKAVLEALLPIAR
jgi:sugar phosphate isomerase/epimerase